MADTTQDRYTHIPRPTIWKMYAEIELAAPPAQWCPHNNWLRLIRWRRFRREQEEKASQMLYAIEAVSRFPCPVVAEKAPHYSQPWPMKIQTYTFEATQARHCAIIARRYVQVRRFQIAKVQDGGRWCDEAGLLIEVA